MRLGFIGVGHIAHCLVEGLLSGEHACSRVLLSPRGRRHVAALAARYPAIEIAEHNQAVVDGSDLLVLAVLPGQAEDVLAGLRLRPEQIVVSLIATVPMTRIAALAKPATRLQRAVPLPGSARRDGPIAVFPDLAETRDLWDTLGARVGCRSEEELETLWTVTALIAPFYALLDDIQGWCAEQGAEPAAATAYVAAFYASLANGAGGAVHSDAGNGEGFADLARAAQTPGGLNEQAIGILAGHGGNAGVRAAMEAVRERLREAANKRGRT